MYKLLAILYLVTFALLIFSKSKFRLPEKKLPNPLFQLFILFSLLALALNIYFIFQVYYAAFNPDYAYEKTVKLVDYHIYRPQFIPGKREQSTHFYIWNNKLANQNNVVRVVYSPALSSIFRGDQTKPIVVSQVKVGTNFNLIKYLESLRDQNIKRDIEIRPVIITNPSTKQAFIRQKPYENTYFIELDLLMADGVLITITTLGETPDNMIKMAGSLY